MIVLIIFMDITGKPVKRFLKKRNLKSKWILKLKKG